MVNFFNIKNTFIINSNFNIKEAPESCSLIITSPPHFDIYGNIIAWKKLMTDIIRYAEKALISWKLSYFKYTKRFKNFFTFYKS